MGRIAFGSLLALVAPVMLLSGYLYLTRATNLRWSDQSDFLALAISVAVGVAGLLLLVRDNLKRLVGAVVYAFATYYVLFGYTLAFVCSAFGDCL